MGSPTVSSSLSPSAFCQLLTSQALRKCHVTDGTGKEFSSGIPLLSSSFLASQDMRICVDQQIISAVSFLRLALKHPADEVTFGGVSSFDFCSWASPVFDMKRQGCSIHSWETDPTSQQLHLHTGHYSRLTFGRLRKLARSNPISTETLQSPSQWKL